jgi:hypothetical protein
LPFLGVALAMIFATPGLSQSSLSVSTKALMYPLAPMYW